MAIIKLTPPPATTTPNYRHQPPPSCSPRTTKTSSTPVYKIKKIQPNTKSENDVIEIEHNNVVCVTSGVSYLGSALVNRLVACGYHVRVIVHNQGDMEKLGEMKSNMITPVLSNLMKPESIMNALIGCHGVFHTTSFIDPAGFSGYSKTMAEIEVKATENVMEACVATPTVRKCVLTSSLLACIWQQNHVNDSIFPTVIDHRNWSDESICQTKRLWYASGKLRSEKAAWRIAKNTTLNLTTICSGLLTGPDFSTQNPTATIAYLKGANEMYKNGVLATVNVTNLAETHVRVFKEMNTTAFGRYVCFDKVVNGYEEGKKLAEEVGVAEEVITGSGFVEELCRFELSNVKVRNLFSRTCVKRCNKF